MTSADAPLPKAVAEQFSLDDVPVLPAGRYDRMLARTGGFTVRAKVYAEGGEHELHTHLDEDHLYLVLAGQVTFQMGDSGETIIADRNSGVFLPRGACHAFTSTGNENLVMCRVGYCHTDMPRRTGEHGEELPIYPLEEPSAEGHLY